MKESNYNKSIHFSGRIWMTVAIILFTAVPVWISVYYDAWPPIMDILVGLLGVAPVFWTVGIIEVLTYVPMFGAAGSYLAFITGNLTNLKLPAALNAMQATGAEAGSDEGEVVSTLAIGVSSIVTTLIISAGVLLLAQIEPVLQSPVLQPAFNNILPALFGGLAVVFVSKSPKIAAAPLIFMIVLFILVPSLASAVGVLVPVGSGIAILVARILYKKGKLS